MADITYTRQFFQHSDWTDFVDPVQAGGTNGFNIRFHNLETEFDQISKVIAQINTAILAAGQKPPTQAKITLTPSLTTTAAVGWTHQAGFAQKLGGQTSAQGMMSVDLPNGIKIISLRVTGQNADSTGTSPGSGVLSITLQRQKVILDASHADRIALVQGVGSPFDSSAPADTQFATVDTDQFKYFIVAQLNNAAATDNVVLSAFQITYLTA